MSDKKKKAREKAVEMLRDRAMNNGLKNEAQQGARFQKANTPRKETTTSPQTKTTPKTNTSPTTTGKSFQSSVRTSQSPSATQKVFDKTARLTATDKYGDSSARGDGRGRSASATATYRDRHGVTLKTGRDVEKYDSDLVKNRTNRSGYTTRGAVRQFVGGHLASIGTTAQTVETTARSYNKAKAKYESDANYKLRTREDALKREQNYNDRLGVKEGIDLKNVERRYDLYDPNGFSQKLIRTGDRYIEQGSKDIEKAKEGANGLQRLGVDLGANAIQMAGDRLMAFVPGVGQALAMGSLMNRAGGTASYEARQLGMNPDQQATYQQGTALIEGLSEGIFNSVSAFRSTYGKGAFSLADRVSTSKAAAKIVDRFMKSEGGKAFALNLARLGAQGFEEGIEEVVADLAEPALKYALQKSTDPSTKFEGYDIKNIAYDFLVGALMGAIPGGIEAATGIQSDIQMSKAMADGKIHADEVIARGLVQQRMGENGRLGNKTNAEVMAERLQQQQAENIPIQPIQMRVLEEALGESSEANARAFERRGQENERQAVESGALRPSTGTRAEQTAYERGEMALEDRNTETVKETVKEATGKDISENAAMTVGRVVSGTATNDDIDTILTDTETRQAVETVLDRKLSLNNAEARATLEDVITMNEVANKDTLRAEVQKEHAGDIAREVNMSKRGGKLFTENYNEAVDVIGNPSVYEDVFIRLYSDGMIQGSDFNDVYDRVVGSYGGRVADYFTKDVAFKAFNEGRIVMAENKAKSSANIRAKISEGSYGAFVESDAEAYLNEAQRDALDKMAKRGNVTIHIVKSIPILDENGKQKLDSNGKPMSANGYYKNGVITIAADADNKLITVAKHELTHHIKKISPKRYQELEDFVFKKWYDSDPEKMEDAIREKQLQYQDITVEEAREEIMADASEAFFTDEGAIHEVMSFSEKLGKAIHDGIHALLDSFIGLDRSQRYAEDGEEGYRYQGYGDFLKDLDILRDAERMWLDALEDTVKGEETGTFTDESTGENVSFSIRKGAPPEKTKTGYKVFVVKDGELYPPMVANPNGEPTPVGVWLDADEGVRAGTSKTGRPQVKAGGKGTQGGSGTLAYRPGWHLGEMPLAQQFARKDSEGNKTLFPKNFVWAECEIAADKNYQDEAMSYGYTDNGKFRHSYAGLPRIPVDGFYQYRTNPDPNTVPWLITGAMKINRILSDAEVKDILAEKGIEAPKRQGGDKTLEELGIKGDTKFSLKETDQAYMDAVNKGDMKTAQKMVDEQAKKNGYDIKAYHGTGQKFTRFDRNKQGSNFEGYLQYGNGFYFAQSEKGAKAWGNFGQRYGGDDVMSVYLKADRMLDIQKEAPDWAKHFLLENGLSESEASFVTLSSDRFLKTLLEGLHMSNQEVQDLLISKGYDGIKELYRNATGQLVVFYPVQIKSADPVTYNDDGEVIPLSKRFTEMTDDIRYSVKASNEELASRDDTAIFINNTDKVNYISMILNGQKTEETRARRTLDKFIGKEKFLTDGKKVYGTITLGEPHKYTSEEFHTREAQKKHRVPRGDEYDIQDGKTKWAYPIEAYKKFDKPLKLSKGTDYLGSRQARQVIFSVSEKPPMSVLDKSGATLDNKSGSPVAKFETDGSAQFSIRTYDESGRKLLRDYLDNLVENNEFTQEEADNMFNEMETLYSVVKQFADKKDKDGNPLYAPFTAWSYGDIVVGEDGKPVFSAIKKNSEYKMNIDFSTICKKRRTLDNVFRVMINRGLFEKLDLNKDESAALVVNINDLIRSRGFEAACALCFVEARRYRQQQTAKTFTDMWNGLVESMYDDASKISYFNYGEDTTAEDVPDGIHTFADADLDLSYLQKLATEKNDKGGLKQTAEAKAARLILRDPSQRKLMRVGDMMASTGFENMQVKNPELMKIYNAKKGTGGAKSSFGDVQYLNEIIGSKTFSRTAAYNVSGVRIQSFSDYVPRMVFDYIQVIGDLAAKKLPAHAYTKEALFALQFGLTGVKINMSLVPDVVKDGIAPGLDRNGNYVWNTDGTFPYEEALKIQKAEGYKENCGTIAVGISDEHIWKMLHDPTIQMVIPYHKSSLNPLVAAMTNVSRFTDYTDFQNTKDANGNTVKKDFDWDKKLYKLSHGKNGKLLPKSEWGDIQELVREYVDWCEERGYTPKFSQFLYAREGDEFDGKIITDENGNKVIDSGYYKMLEDFGLLDNDGNFKPQDDVKMRFPTKESAFGSMESLIKRGLEEDTNLEADRSSKIEGIVDEIETMIDDGSITKQTIFSEALASKMTDADKFSLKTNDTVQRLIDERKQKANDGEQMSFFGSLNETLPAKPKAKTPAEMFYDDVLTAIAEIKKKGGWSGKEITHLLDETMYGGENDFHFIERLNDKDDDTALSDFNAFLSLFTSEEDLSNYKWYFSQYRVDKYWKTAFRSGKFKFSKAIDKRVEEIKAGKIGGRDVGIEKRDYTPEEMRKLFNDLNTDKDLKELGKKVFDCIDKNFDVRYQGVLNIKGFNFSDGGIFGEAGGRTVHLNMKYFNSGAFTDQQKASTLLHESIHAVTVYAINTWHGNDPYQLSFEMRTACNTLDEVYNKIKYDKDFAGEYGTKNVKEMVAELSNPVFRAKLKAKQLFEKILNALRKIFGLTTTDGKRISALDAANEALEVILTNADSVSFERFANRVSAQYNGKFSLKTTDTKAELQNTISKLEQNVSTLKAEFKRTDLKTADPKDVRVQAGKLLKRHDSNLSMQKDLENTFNEIFRLYKEEGTEAFDKVYEIAKDAAVNVVNNIGFIHDEGAEEYKAIKDYLKTTEITIDDSMKKNITDYEDFRKKNFGRLKLKNGSQSNIDNVYMELSELFPEQFTDDYVNPADQLYHMVDVLDSYKPYYETLDGASPEMQDYVVDIASDIMETAYGLQTKKTFADKKYLEKEAAVKKAREEALASRNKAIERTKQRYEKKLNDLKEHNKEIRANRKARREDSEARTKLLKIARRLDRLKTTAQNRERIDSLIGELDLVAKGMTKKSLEKLTDLKDWYEDKKANDPDFIADANIEKKLDRLAKKQIKDMSLEDVRDLYDVLSNIENEIATNKKFIESEIKKEVREAGKETIANINKSKGINKKLRDLDGFFINGTLSPLRQIRRVTGYVDNDPLYIATKELADGQRKMLDYQMTSWKAFDRFMKDKKFISRLNGKNAEEIEVSGTKDGQPYRVKITPDIRMAMYLASMDNDNLRHMKYGGIKIPDIKLYKKGKIQEAISDGVIVQFTPSQLAEISSHMTKEEKDFAQEAFKYYNVTSPQAINDTSEILKGYSIARVDNYYPIHTDTNFLAKEFDTLKFDGTIEGMGFLKERVKASEPIIMTGLIDTLTRSIEMNSKYVGLAIPVRNFGKLFGMKDVAFTEEEQNGELVYKPDYRGSVQDSIVKRWGDSVFNYIEKFMTDIQSGRKSADDWEKTFNKMRSRYAGAVLTMNASVALKQAASYPTAAAVLGRAPLVRAMADVGKVDLDLIAKYTPLQWYRSQGFSTTELGDIKSGSRKTLLESVPALNWIQGMDLMTTRKLWKASEYYVRMKNKNLKVGTDEYYKAVADIYNRVIEETQPNYTTLQRPGLLRSDSSLVQMLNMFKTQPYQNFNIVYDALGNYMAKRSQYRTMKNAATKKALKDATTDLRNAIDSQIMQLAVFAAMTSLWALFRRRDDKYRDEKGNISFESYLKGLTKDMASNSFAVVPFGSDIYGTVSSAITGEYYYGFTSVTDSSITDFFNSMKDGYTTVGEWIEYAKKDDPEKKPDTDMYKDIEKVAESTGRFLGVPFSNIKNTIDGIYGQVAILKDGEYIGGYEAQKMTLAKDREKLETLFRAYQNDQKAYEELRKMMIGDGISEDKIDYFINKKKKENPSDEEKEKMDQSIKTLEKSNIWKGASEDDKDKYGKYLENIALGIENTNTNSITKYAIDGLTNEQVVLFKLALRKVDKPNRNGNLGSFDKNEKEEALKLLMRNYKFTEKQKETLKSIKS